MVGNSEVSHTFVVDWAASWSSIEEVRAAHRAFDQASKRVAARGIAIQCLHSVFVTGDSRWICLFTAQDSNAAGLTANLAQIPQRFIREGVEVMALPDRVSVALSGRRL
nr:hypothetical protein [Rhodococcus sp. (in: high G+C Gram-positive bacteria)]